MIGGWQPKETTDGQALPPTSGSSATKNSDKMAEEAYCRGYQDGFKDALDIYRPVTTPKQPTTPPSWPPVQQKIVCPKCKIDMTGFMGYVCLNSGCPNLTYVMSSSRE